MQLLFIIQTVITDKTINKHFHFVHGSRYKLYISHCMCSSTHDYVYTCTLENKIRLSIQRVPPAVDGQKEYRCAHKTHQNTKQHTRQTTVNTIFTEAHQLENTK